MQNKWCSANENGFVKLDGGWRCGRCGSVSEACGCCAQCGWNGWDWNRNGCWAGGVVRAANQADCARNADCGCEECPAGFVMGHSVQRCPENTRIRRDCDCEANTAYQGCCGKADCGCEANTAYQGRCGKADCVCEANTAYQGRCGKADCDCGAETAYQGRCGKADCGCEAETAYQGRRDNRGVGIVHAVEQKLADVFESESALRTGTLFPELHKPMNGRCPGCSNCSTSEQQAAFAAWDLRLYLNTHPEDQEALALFRRLCRETEEPNYATTFLEDEGAGSCWGWTDGPWPWECQRCGK